MAALSQAGFHVPADHYAKYNCEAFALELNSWSQASAGKLFSSSEDAQSWAVTEFSKKLTMPTQGAGNLVCFWFPTAKYPNRYHWARQITGCKQYNFAAKLGSSKGIYLYKCYNDLVNDVENKYKYPATDLPVFLQYNED
jgi:hypothetical protein